VFWQLYLDGATIEDSARGIGVSATAGRGLIINCGGMKPDLDRPSGRYLSESERELLDECWDEGWPKVEIAELLGRHPSTIGRELARNHMVRRVPYVRPGPAARAGARCRPGPAPGTPRPPRGRPVRYRAAVAQAKADKRARRPKPGKLATNPVLRAEVEAGLRKRWSPEMISARLRRDFPENPEMRVAPETIYQALYVQGRGQLRRELHRCLRTGRAIRKPHRRSDTRRGRIPGMVNISERPAEADDRAVEGHWEGDLIIGKNSASAIGTLVERTSRFTMLLHLPERHGAEEVRDAIIPTITSLPQQIRQSLTWDQGVEMINHAEITFATDLPIFFCDPHSPWQRGSNENTNGLLRQYFPKGTDLSVHNLEHLTAVAAELNGRPRKTLGWDTPAEYLARLLSRPVTVGIATTP
jgi:IS30 family transposase